MLLFAAIATFTLLLTSCTETVFECNPPYIINGNTCCLDKNSNNICDSDEKDACPPCELDCSSCPVQEKEKLVQVTKYICEDGREVDDKATCKKTSGPQPLTYQPVTTNEEGTHIEEVSITPACRASFPGGDVYYKTDTVPGEVVIELKELPDGDWQDFYTIPRAYLERRVEFVICDVRCPHNQGDFTLPPSKAYVMRLRMTQPVWGTTEFSNEHIVDTREGGAFVSKKC
ncbi:hypothetical protein D6783_04045 [Candidatus Woesearchaeota archaeon]|nr:MAG: hypothetical protein D6783_04045 [Candidatus Woesearchaeota archaeon]